MGAFYMIVTAVTGLGVRELVFRLRKDDSE